jgi:hypothetical protein
MKKALESELGFFPADAETAVVLEPCDGSLHRSAPALAAQRATILSLGSVGSVGSNHFDAFGRKRSIQRIAVISLIGNDSRRELFGKHEAEEFLDEYAFVRRSRAGAHGYRESLGIHKDHDFDSLAGLGASDAIPNTFGFGESSIDETLVEAGAPLFLNKASQGVQNLFEDAILNPASKPAVNTAFGAKRFGQVFPFGSIVQNPEDSGQGIALGNRRATALGTGLKIGNKFAEHIQLFIGKI